MKLILLSGGSGKRLWPLSNSLRSKQFLKILQNENNTLESMLERIWKQLHKVGLADSATVVTNKTQIDMIHNQLSTSIQCIVEPERRDTFAAIALASAYLYSLPDSSASETVIVMPVDMYVEIDFFERILDLEEALLSTGAELALLGVRPTSPSSQYGYMVPDSHDANQPILKINCFHEKPTEEVAQKLINQQALWNCGIFAFKLEYMIQLLLERDLPSDFDTLYQEYETLEKISFDYAVLEKATNICSLVYNGFWKDLGNWSTLTEEIGEKLTGKGHISTNSSNTHLINELDIPIVIMDACNLVVAASPDGILIADKKASHGIKDLVDKIELRPMFEERRWGWYRVLDYHQFEHGNEVLTKRIGVIGGKNLSYQKHFNRREVWTIISGLGEFVLNEVVYQVKSGDVLEIAVNARHGIKAITNLEIIEVQIGPILSEEDIERIFMKWDEVMDFCAQIHTLTN